MCTLGAFASWMLAISPDMLCCYVQWKDRCVPMCIELDLVDMLTLSHGVLSRRAISLSLSASRGSFFVGPRPKFRVRLYFLAQAQRRSLHSGFSFVVYWVIWHASVDWFLCDVTRGEVAGCTQRNICGTSVFLKPKDYYCTRNKHEAWIYTLLQCWRYTFHDLEYLFYWQPKSERHILFLY